MHYFKFIIINTLYTIVHYFILFYVLVHCTDYHYLWLILLYFLAILKINLIRYECYDLYTL